MSADVIIVGAGMAGLVCAYECASASLNVTLIHPGEIQETSSYYAQGGIAASWSDFDSSVLHMEDTILAGAGLSDTNIVQSFCEAAPNFIQWLIDLGVPFDRNDFGDFLLTKEGAHSQDRIFHVRDFTGHAIINTLYNHLHQHPLITWIDGSVSSFLKKGNRLTGVKVDDMLYFSHNIVLATGGYSNIFSQSTNPNTSLPLPIALAYQAGAKMGDLEFIQYHPTVFCQPGFPPLLISEALRGEGAFLVNKNNERFMQRYHELEDLAPRDVVSRAISQEESPKLNISPLMPIMQERFPTIYQRLLERGFTHSMYEIPVQPLVHYTIGGIVADHFGQTNLNGLYAIGEVAVTGFHGANRLASNSLLEAGVMAKSCAERIVESGLFNSDESYDLMIDYQPLSSKELDWIGELCRKSLGVIRSKDVFIAAIYDLIEHPKSTHPLFEFVLGVIQSALHRTESRGGHYYLDYSQVSDDVYHSNIQINQEVLHTESFFKSQLI